LVFLSGLVVFPLLRDFFASILSST
jgi:hypothetical protein